MHNMDRKYIFILVIFCFLILGAGLWLYIAHFSGGWSTDNSVWGTFGDFFNVFVNIANLICVIIIAILTINSSIRIAKLQVMLSESQLKIEQLKIVPHLYTNEKRSSVANQDSWFIHHTGEGPAINILVRFNLGRNAQFTRWISCLSIGANEERELVWLRNADTIQFSYCDITEENCFLYTFQDRIGLTNSIPKEDYLNYRDQAIANNFNTHPNLVNRYLNGGNTNFGPFFNGLL